jgi:hypothetical protein
VGERVETRVALEGGALVRGEGKSEKKGGGLDLVDDSWGEDLGYPFVAPPFDTVPK